MSLPSSPQWMGRQTWKPARFATNFPSPSPALFPPHSLSLLAPLPTLQGLDSRFVHSHFPHSVTRLATRRVLFYAWAMFSKPRQVETETQLYEAAVRALMRRAYSVYEMKQLLARRTEDDKLLRTVMDRLKRANMIDDERFAKQFARQRTEIRRQGKFRIARDLRARGVPDRHIEAALAESAKETDEAAIVRQRLERKLRSFRGEIGENKIASMYRSLLRAGFSAAVVRRELKAVTREEVPEPESQPDE